MNRPIYHGIAKHMQTCFKERRETTLMSLDKQQANASLAGRTFTHHGPVVSRFLVSNGSTDGAGCLRGLLRLIQTHFENISGALS